MLLARLPAPLTQGHGLDALTSNIKGGTSGACSFMHFGHTLAPDVQQLVAADVRLVASLLTGRG